MKVYLLLAAFSALLAAFYGTWKTGFSSGENFVRLEIGNAQREVDLAWRKELKSASKEVDQLQIELIEEKKNIKVKLKTVVKEIKTYVKEDNNCNYSRGFVRLYNKSWHSETGMPDSSNLPNSEASEASSVSQRTIAEKSAEYAAWCTELEVTFDSLVKTIEINQGIE